MADFSRYEPALAPETWYEPLVLGPRCHICRIPLEDTRLGSLMDTICDRAVNPGEPSLWDHQGHGVRSGDWTYRARRLRRLHRDLMGNTPGWDGRRPEQLLAAIG